MKNALSFDPGVVLKIGVTLGAYTPTPILRADQLPGVRQPPRCRRDRVAPEGICF